MSAEPVAPGDLLGAARHRTVPNPVGLPAHREETDVKMSRPIRAALAIACSVAALTAGATTAYASGHDAVSAMKAAKAAVGDAAQPTPRAATTAPSVVQFQNEHSGKCLTIAGGSLANGANAVQATCADGADNQAFELVPAGNATFMVRAMHSGACLEVENSGKGAGANVQQWWCVNGPQQRWRLVVADVSKGLYELRPAHVDNRCAGIAMSSKDDGANVLQWTCNQTTPEHWRLVPVGA
ncbi:RICIN domain-containing protein [Streptomyces sp. BHT-5-2]|uniref:RICIN domain-containing protein n=1 Tax=Streptomyces sp. BHT-5-2 TaxID=2866715 RepID=UPI001C8EB472|nr:RICIN domain-containing protein [Streptomyces sp. BHT-5-2]QZL05644.1 RICIN domain-containing protein [Streptomyces sp. BHT-5-2]